MARTTKAKPVGPEVIYGVSQSMLSVARHYGRCTYNGQSYIYNPVDDTLTRADVLAARKEYRVMADRPNDHDEYIGGPHKTLAAAVAAAKSVGGGRLVVVFGPNGLQPPFWRDGKPAQPSTSPG